MGLGVYTNTTATPFSTGGALTNPFEVVEDGRESSSFETLLYLHNNDATYYFTSISIKPVTTTGMDLTAGANGYVFRLSAGSAEPSLAAWASITPGSSIAMSSLGSFGHPDTSTYLPFWVRVETPQNAPVNTFSSVQLAITCNQNTA